MIGELSSNRKEAKMDNIKEISTEELERMMLQIQEELKARKGNNVPRYELHLYANRYTIGIKEKNDDNTEVYRGNPSITYNPLSDYSGLSGLRAGFGISLKNFGIDYAVSPYGKLGISHRISLYFRKI